RGRPAATRPTGRATGTRRRSGRRTRDPPAPAPPRARRATPAPVARVGGRPSTTALPGSPVDHARDCDVRHTGARRPGGHRASRCRRARRSGAALLGGEAIGAVLVRPLGEPALGLVDVAA